MCNFSFQVDLKKNGVSRNEPVLIIGGGVISDIGGFACALYHRSTPYVMLCTSIVSGKSLIHAAVCLQKKSPDCLFTFFQALMLDHLLELAVMDLDTKISMVHTIPQSKLLLIDSSSTLCILDGLGMVLLKSSR